MNEMSQMGNIHAGRFIFKQFIKRNTDYLKRRSSGKDLVIFCNYTKFEWSPAVSDGGFGGSEEAVINLSRELAKLGWEVTVYNSCGHRPVMDSGVVYRPFWEFNPRDRQDVVILWRWPKPLDWNINADRIFVDMHDVIPETMFTHRDRIARATRIFLKSTFQRSLFPNLPDDKLVVVPNGIDLTVLHGQEQKDPYLLINTSAADRSMSVLPKLFREVKRQVPQVRLQWAYGWKLFALFSANDPQRMQWMRETQAKMDAASIESVGYLSHSEVGKLYQRGAILAHPTSFPEIDPISVRKAQACGCVPVTTEFGGLIDAVQFGVKIPCKHTAEWMRPDRFPYGIEDPDLQRSWVDATVDLLTNPHKRSDLAAQGAAWARQFGWPQIAARWNAVFNGQYVPASNVRDGTL
jgi:glycosyltransferase involved in cell wall biosynthesis